MEKRNIKYMFDKTSETPSNDVTRIAVNQETNSLSVEIKNREAMLTSLCNIVRQKGMWQSLEVAIR